MASWAVLHLLLVTMSYVVVVLALGCCVVVLHVMLGHVVDAGLQRFRKHCSASLSGILLLRVGFFYCVSMCMGVLHYFSIIVASAVGVPCHSDFDLSLIVPPTKFKHQHSIMVI